ncbi:type IV pilin protein [Methylovulum miyakonense]|uniref:type IV pilin protein n=1 Tax=Methylovulum miyakonense TaxID=645578 RepID=UPI00036689FF|nr:type IV pilin protein [Methylovulum miyakonense]
MNVAKKNQGFTLVELMISVAIVGILAGIAYPSYQENVRKSHRADAQAVLMNLVNIMERRFTETNDYTLVPAQDPTPYYNIVINATATTYTLQAVPIDADTCGTLQIDNLGNKSPAGCW